eukprot:gene31576-41005_t
MILEISAASCASLTKQYYKETPFDTCANLLAGHDIYFTSNCPVSIPRLCVEPIPAGFQSLNSSAEKSVDKPIHYYPDEKKIAFANITAVKDRINLPKQVAIRADISLDCLKCWDYDAQKVLWSTYVDNIETVTGIKFLNNGNIRTVLEFGCGSGGFLAEMFARGVMGICTAKDISKDQGATSQIPYLRTVAARGLLAMHISITDHQPFLSNTFNFIHCSWVLAYVEQTPEVYTSIMIEWDRLLTPGGLVVQQGAWSPKRNSGDTDVLWEYVKYMLQNVLQWNIIKWEVEVKDGLGKVLNFMATKPLQRINKDNWAEDPTIKAGCPNCFTAARTKQLLN